MLGEQITDWKGKRISQRVLDTEGPTMETTLSFTGSVRGIPVNQTVTFIGRPASPGVIHAEGHGVIMAGESEMASYTAEAFGKISSKGSVNWRGAHFNRTSSTGKLAFLDSTVHIFEGEIDAEGNVTHKSWEWK